MARLHKHGRQFSEEVQKASKELREALKENDPSCLDDDRFVESRPTPLTSAERIELYKICFECPVFEECHEYARVLKPNAGFWAGKNHGTWERGS